MLPTINAPTFEINLISQTVPVRYRPFTVKEEKILLVAEESDNERDSVFAIKQVVQNCCVSTLDVDTLPLFDLLYFYIQLRAKSVNNISEVSYRDKEDDQIYKFEIDFDSIVPVAGDGHSREITLDKDFIVTFKYPTFDMINRLGNVDPDSIETTIDLLEMCMDKIINGDEVYVCDNVTREERVSFIESLTTSQFEKIVEAFILTMPKISYKIEYTNTLDHKRTIILESPGDFFQ